MNFMTVDFAFLAAFIFGAVFFIVGLVVGVRHAKRDSVSALSVNNMLVSAITGWLRSDKTRIIEEMQVRNQDIFSSVDKVANEIEHRFIRKGVK